MTLPQTRYTSLGGADIAYQVLGDGPLDLVYANGLTEHIDGQWEHPLMARFLERLASFSRLIIFDRRGAGASDPVPLDTLPTWEEWTDDLRTVLDAVGSERTAIYAELDAGPVAMIFAATYPERTSALILGNTSARYTQAEDYPEGFSAEAVEEIAEWFRATWGTEEFIARTFPAWPAIPPSCAGGPSSCGRRPPHARRRRNIATSSGSTCVRCFPPSLSRPWCCTGPSSPWSPSSTAATSPTTSRTRGSWRSPGRRLVLHQGRRGGPGRGGRVPHRSAAASCARPDAGDRAVQ